MTLHPACDILNMLGAVRDRPILHSEVIFMIRKAELTDLPTVTSLALRLWPGHTYEDLSRGLAEIIAGEESAIFLAFQEGKGVGFAQCQLRHDYVEGTDSSPVGYLEGIFVAESCRGQGMASNLLAACEAWARTQGCGEFASDCELTNTQSLAFHLKLGFAEANRIICFTKKL